MAAGALSACCFTPVGEPFDSGAPDLDAGVQDGGIDAGPDGGLDAGPDAGLDSGPDAGIDGGPDAGLDAGPDGGGQSTCQLDGVNYPSRAHNPRDFSQCCNPALGWVPQFSTNVVTVSAPPYNFAIADMDGDNTPDIVYVSHDGDSLQVLYNRGGNYVAGPLIDLGQGSAPGSVAAGELNGDGYTDLVVVNTGSPDFTIFYGQADGGLNAAFSYATAPSPSFVALGDLNGDGNLDAVVAGYEAAQIFFGTGAQPPFGGRPPVIATAGSSTGLTIGRFTGTGLGFATSNTSGFVSVVLGNDAGGFDAVPPLVAGDSLYAITSGDLNGDGFVDLVVAEADTQRLGFFLGFGDGSFGPHQKVSAGAGSQPNAVAMADFDGDGRADLAATDHNSGLIDVVFQLPDGGFSAPVSFPIGFGAIVTQDLNGDGAPDLVAARNAVDTSPPTSDAVIILTNACP